MTTKGSNVSVQKELLIRVKDLKWKNKHYGSVSNAINSNVPSIAFDSF